MAFTQEETDRIKAAIIKKAPNLAKCPICGSKNWHVGKEFVTLAAQENLQRIELAGKVLPLIPMRCTNCGNTHLLNIITLGLRDLVEEKEEGKTTEKTKEKTD